MKRRLSTQRVYVCVFHYISVSETRVPVHDRVRRRGARGRNTTDGPHVQRPIASGHRNAIEVYLRYRWTASLTLMSSRHPCALRACASS